MQACDDTFHERVHVGIATSLIALTAGRNDVVVAVAAVRVDLVVLD